MNYTYRIHSIVKVVDGDTVRARVDLGFRVHAEIEFRLLGIDTPEMHGATKALGEQVKLYLERRLSTATEIIVCSEKQEKYGRWLGVLFADGEDLNAKLVELGFAKPYDGGKKS